MKLPIKKIALSVGTITAIATPVLTVTSIKLNNSKKDQFVFDNRIFNSVDEALQYLIKYGKAKTNELKVIGDLDSSFNNYEKGILNKALLPTFSAKDTKFYYLNAGGGLTTDFNSAKNTYYNPGRIRTMYIDGFNDKPFLSEAQAKRSMEENKMNQMIPYYEVEFYGKEGNSVKRLNPFSIDDVKAYKQNITNNINDIIQDNIEAQLAPDGTKTKSGFEISIKDSGGIDSQSMYQFDLADYIRENTKGMEISGSNKSGEITVSKTYDKTSPWTRWRGHEWKIGGNGKYDDRKTYAWKINKKDTSLKYWLSNRDDYQWLQWYGIGFQNIEKHDFLSFLNAEGNNFFYSDEDQKISNIDDGVIDFNTEIDKLLNLTTPSSLKSYLENKSPLLSEGKMSKIYINNILAKIKNQLSTLKKNVASNFDMSPKDISFNPYLTNRTFWHWYSSWDKTEYIKQKGDAKFQASYRAKTSSKINLTNMYQPNSKLFKTLSNWSDKSKSIDITINKNGISLFDLNLGIDQNNKIKVYFIEVSKANHEANSGEKAFTLKNSNGSPSYYQYYKNLLKSLFPSSKGTKYSHDLIIMNKWVLAKNAFARIKAFFDSTDPTISPQDPDWLYRENLWSNKKKLIEPEDIFRMYLTTIYDSYQKYQKSNNLAIFQTIAEKLPWTENILKYQYLDGRDKSTKPLLAKYRLRSIKSFNAKLTSGVYETADINPGDTKSKNAQGTFYLATQKPGWTSILTNPSKDLPAQILVAYDNNGKQVNVGDYKFDDEIVMEFNIKLKMQPRREYNYVYVKVDNVGKRFLNKITNIFELDFKKAKLYFNEYAKLKNYLVKHIQDNSYWI